ncbi:unnamed protein product [marine sediment metagenome]|uniref:Uncharacterized protein n=1 Tax=marine sediment metagenome TaxID=412755 RepID=X0RSS6_9ZZZZ
MTSVGMNNNLNGERELAGEGLGWWWHAPTKDTTSYVRVKDIIVSGAGGR